MRRTLALGQVLPSVRSEALHIVSKAQADRVISNRSNVSRYTEMLAAVLSVLQTGRSIEITDLKWDGSKAPAYNLAHRMLSAQLIRPYFDRVQVVALSTKTIVQNGSSIEGTTNTTAPVGEVRLFVAPKMI